MARFDKGLAFCREYIKDHNATQAAKRAGYSEKTSYSQGQRLLKKVEIKSEVAQLEAKSAEKAELTVQKVLADIDFGLQLAKSQKDCGAIARLSELNGRYLSMFKDNVNIADSVKQAELDVNEQREAVRIANLLTAPEQKAG